ncbi:translation initiation factor eIF-2B epsilon, putative [Theileria equi strain WA]|uniref:Translation initiation factor eIF2B subunit epsilon n=1 Tax=Theileria equi strain WA TaxID=1537102 RepID=L0AXV6_THEEQ|nr:translation initiation factor eIF-2B epsilon, putative [Theileria equi strain WA]AFZ80392.1 translation initiation factor eIF-2B epsilon, putative [Theileria equi strain WA]|eukprot:XP_004830058.1 translation initiation factor eIF-2B epsilon, putative [Theileria equi strain WA]
MEAVILQDSENLAFEPLASYMNLGDLRIGDTLIFHETVQNLWYSGVTAAYLLVDVNKAPKYEKYNKRFNFGKKDGYIDVEVVGINVDKMEVGPALREFVSLKGSRESFVLLYANTLLTVSLSEAIELHYTRAKTHSKYCMSVLFVKDDESRSLSTTSNTSTILLDGNDELMAYGHNSDTFELDDSYMSQFKNAESIRVMYNLCHGDVYICTSSVIDHFLELFDHDTMHQFINGSLTDDIKTTEIYATIVPNDISFPTYPSVIKIATPRIYYNVYMQYIRRFDKSSEAKAKDAYSSENGPLIRSDSLFVNGGAVSSDQDEPHSIASATVSSIVGKNTKIGNGSRVLNSIIFGDAVIGDNCTIQDALIMNDVKILDGSTVASGSIVGSHCTVNSKGDTVLKSANSQNKFVDLTDSTYDDRHVHGYVSQGHFWNVDGFYTDPGLDSMGSDYYKHVAFKLPQTAAGDADTCYTDSGSESFESEELDKVDELPSEDFMFELDSMIRDALESPKHLENKLLEIRSLRIAHHVTEDDVVKFIYSFGIRWIVEKNNFEDLNSIIEDSLFAELLHSFSSTLPNDAFFQEAFRVFSQFDDNMLNFCSLCEALYHTDAVDFTGFHDWVQEKGINEPRIVAFAEWVESD